MQKQSLSEILRDLRTNAGLTAQQAAKGLHENYKTYQAWEDGRANPRFNKLPDIAKFYRIKIDDLFNDESILAEPSIELKYEAAPEHIQNAIKLLLGLN